MSKLSADMVRARNAKLNDAYHAFSVSANGKAILDDLEKKFVNRASAKLADGRVDVYATMINEGARQCVLYILNRARGDNERMVD